MDDLEPRTIAVDDLFEESWRILLEKFGIHAPLHMREFTPHGRLAHISTVDKRRVFAQVADLIHSHSIASLAAILPNEEYETAIRTRSGYRGRAADCDCTLAFEGS